MTEVQVDTTRRFGGVSRLYGPAGAKAIATGHVLVVGVGGVGSWVAEALARSAVGQLTLIDPDHVAESNMNRQIHATDDTLGMAKVDAMRQRVMRFAPGAKVDAVDAEVTPEHWPAVAAQWVNSRTVVVDACDHLPAKLAMASWAQATGCALLCVGAAGGKRLAHNVQIADLAHTTHDPLLANLRARLRRTLGTAGPAPGKRARPLGLPCVYSPEPVMHAPGPSDAPGAALGCHGYGSSAAVTGAFGLAAAAWALDQLARLLPPSSPV
jgi:tRNA A37 threonylcarbamoyladenosine dehydratase